MQSIHSTHRYAVRSLYHCPSTAAVSSDFPAVADLSGVADALIGAAIE